MTFLKIVLLQLILQKICFSMQSRASKSDKVTGDTLLHQQYQVFKDLRNEISCCSTLLNHNLDIVFNLSRDSVFQVDNKYYQNSDNQ